MDNKFPGEKIKLAASQALARYYATTQEIVPVQQTILEVAKDSQNQALLLEAGGRWMLAMAQRVNQQGKGLAIASDHLSQIANDLEAERQDLANKITIVGNEGAFFELDLNTSIAYLKRVEPPIFKEALQSLSDDRKKELGLD